MKHVRESNLWKYPPTHKQIRIVINESIKEITALRREFLPAPKIQEDGMLDITMNRRS